MIKISREAPKTKATTVKMCFVFEELGVTISFTKKVGETFDKNFYCSREIQTEKGVEKDYVFFNPVSAKLYCRHEIRIIGGGFQDSFEEIPLRGKNTSTYDVIGGLKIDDNWQGFPCQFFIFSYIIINNI